MDCPQLSACSTCRAAPFGRSGSAPGFPASAGPDSDWRTRLFAASVPGACRGSPELFRSAAFEVSVGPDPVADEGVDEQVPYPACRESPGVRGTCEPSSDRAQLSRRVSASVAGALKGQCFPRHFERGHSLRREHCSSLNSGRPAKRFCLSRCIPIFGSCGCRWSTAGINAGIDHQTHHPLRHPLFRTSRTKSSEGVCGFPLVFPRKLSASARKASRANSPIPNHRKGRSSLSTVRFRRLNEPVTTGR